AGSSGWFAQPWPFWPDSGVLIAPPFRLPFCRLPVTPLSVPVTEPRPVLEPELVLLVVVLLPDSSPKPGVGRGGAAAVDRAGRVGYTGGRVGGIAEGRDGAGDRVQAGQGAGRAASLHRAVGLDRVGGRRRRRAGRGGAAGRADDVGRGRDLAGHGQGYAAQDPAGRVEAAQRDRGVLRLRERGGGDAHR